MSSSSLQPIEDKSDPDDVNNINNRLTRDLLMVIFSRLACKFAIRCQSVCKLWHNVVSNPCFTRSLIGHQVSGKRRQEEEEEEQVSVYVYRKRFVILGNLDQFSLDFLPCFQGENDYSRGFVLSSCNGLLLCSVSCGSDDAMYYVCNPITKQWAEIPPPPLPHHILHFGLLPVAFLCDPHYHVDSLGAVTLNPHCSLPELARQLKEGTVSDMELHQNIINLGDIPYQEVVRNDLIPPLVNFLVHSSNEIKIEAAKVLNSILQTADFREYLDIIMEQEGAARNFITLLDSQFPYEVNEKGLQLVASATVWYRDALLKQGVLEILVGMDVRMDWGDQEKVKAFAHALKQLCSGCPVPSLLQVRDVWPVLGKLISTENNRIRLCGCEALASLSTGSPEHVQEIINAGMCPRIISLTDDAECGEVALNVIANMCRSSEAHLKAVVAQGALRKFHEILNQKATEPAAIRKVCEAISVFTAESRRIIQMVIDEDLIRLLGSIAKDPSHQPVARSEAVKALRFTIGGGSRDQIRHLVEQGLFIETIVEALNCTDERLQQECMYGIDAMLLKGKRDHMDNGANPYKGYIRQARGFETLRKFQGNPKLKDTAQKIVEMYDHDEVA